MSSDISRQRFDATDDFAAVLMQQGRVLLDADWNEWAELLDRRLRAETTDIVGRCVVPTETPHGFEIALSGTDLTIGPGRIYVDGILAEHHGQPPVEWDAVLAELRGTAAVPYDLQPYLPDPTLHDPPLLDPPPTTGGPHLVYLDVWRREVTWLEDPSLVETAVGVDSTTRWQTVWQVRVLPNVGAGITCQTPDDQVPGWLEVIRPSAGRLSTDTFNAPGDPDPCQVSPTGGYKGLENRLYRVEIHAVDNAGEATFKWARHNASIATAVSELNGEDVVVDLIGRDAGLRFKTGDWVELTDDAHELASLPGIMRKVKNVTDATRTITIDGALPPNTLSSDPDTLRRLHTRVRRWDQKGQVRDINGNVHFDLNATGAGVIPVLPGGAALLLEDGIQVSFSLDPVGGRFRVGDYWVFAARTADASLERLSQAPPRGIHHHYGRLALVTFPATMVDCRTFWPPEFGGAGPDPAVVVNGVRLIGPNRDLPNDTPVTVDELCGSAGDNGGIEFVCSEPIAGVSARSKPVCLVVLEQPFRFQPAPGAPPFVVVGFSPLILAGTVSANGTLLQWRPPPGVREWLRTSLDFLLGTQPETVDRLLIRITLKGNFIWADADSNRHIDGDVFGLPGPGGTTGVGFDSGDGRRGGDLEMWCWLVREAPPPPPPVVIIVPGGLINFSNRVVNVTPPVNAPVFDVDGTTTLAGPAFFAQLFVGLPGGSLAAVDQPQPFRSGAAAGYWTGVVIQLPFPPATLRLDARVRAWSAQAPTFEAAVAAGLPRGESNLLILDVEPAAIPPAPPANLIGLQSFRLATTQ